MTRSRRSTQPLRLALPDPDLNDGDIRLRAWTRPDAPDLAAAWADPEIAKWAGVPMRHDEQAAAAWIAGEEERRTRGLALDLVVEVDGSVAGEVGLVPAEPGPQLVEVGWWTGPAFRGRGVATRAVRLVARWAMSDLGVSTLVARCKLGNPASIAVAQAAGFTRVGSEDDFEVWALRR